MTVESVTHISDLNATYPGASDSRSEGDDHIRNIKTALKTDFPNINGPVSASDEELSYVAGVTSSIQTQLNAKATNASQGLYFLSAATVSSPAGTVDFTSGINSTYEEYEIHFQNVVPDTGGATFTMRVSTNGGSSFVSSNDYDSSIIYSNGTTVSTSGGGSNPQLQLAPTVLSNASLGGLSGVLRIANPANAAAHKQMTWLLVGRAAGSTVNVTSGGGAYAGTTAVNAIRFYFSSGNVASGGFKLYGVRKS